MNYASDAQRRAVMIHLGERMHRAIDRAPLFHGTRPEDAHPALARAQAAERRAAQRGAIRRFFRRHPGAKESAQRAAVVAGLSGAALAGAFYFGRRAKILQGATKGTAQFYRELGTGGSAGLRAWRKGLRGELVAVKELAESSGKWARRLKHTSMLTAGLGIGWAAYPALEQSADRHAFRRAQRNIHATQVYRRSHGRLTRIA